MTTRTHPKFTREEEEAAERGDYPSATIDMSALTPPLVERNGAMFIPFAPGERESMMASIREIAAERRDARFDSAARKKEFRRSYPLPHWAWNLLQKKYGWGSFDKGEEMQKWWCQILSGWRKSEWVDCGPFGSPGLWCW